MEEMAQSVNRSEQGYAQICGKAWTAYLHPFAVMLLLLMADSLAYEMFPEGVFFEKAFVFVAASSFISAFVLMRTTRLYTTDEGVWCFQGVLPWRRGVIGIQWQNFEKATYDNSFTAWASQSYSVTLFHRYTGTQNIRLTQMWRGRAAAQEINALFSHWRARHPHE